MDPKQVGSWTIQTRQVGVTDWRATAMNGGGTYYADGIDCESALRNLAERIGMSSHDVLREFGFE